MVFQRKSPPLGRLLPLLYVGLALGCSDGGTGPKEGLAPLVGAWEATSLVMTNQANPSISVDLLDLGATFTLSILSTGQYSAVLSSMGFIGTEVGTISVSGNQVTLTPTTPPGPPAVSIWSFQGEYLVLEGESAFDFNQDGEAEPTFAYIVLAPQGY